MQKAHSGAGLRDGRRGAGRHAIFAGLDIGTSKVACLIAESDGLAPDGAPILRVIGAGYQASQGVKAGQIVDMDAAEAAARNCVAEAEAMANVTLKRISLASNCGQPVSQFVQIEATLHGQEISDRELRQLIKAARSRCANEGSRIVYSTPLGYSIDGTTGIFDPRGMFGDRLGVKMHVVTAMSGPVQTHEVCAQRCHLEVQETILSSLAGGLSVTVPDERDLGVVVIDIGAGTTSIAVFELGRLVFADVLPVGGYHITTDLARGLSTGIAAAERLKTLYGSVIGTAHDHRDTVLVRRIGEESGPADTKTPRSSLIGIIRPRVEEILEIARDRLTSAGFAATSGRNAVITGGSAQLNGVRELASRILGRHCRLGRPLRLAGLDETTSSGAFSVCAGLILHSAGEGFLSAVDDGATPQSRDGAWPVKNLAGLGQWIKRRF